MALSDGLLEAFPRVDDALDAAAAAILAAPDADTAVRNVIGLDSTGQDDTTAIVVKRERVPGLANGAAVR
ncbi:hypothetical protein [Sinomonas albida]|uniref:hypothetical protein n=1 Tax=Sinomonas albida TaxID=369942 RepID=UPI002E160912